MFTGIVQSKSKKKKIIKKNFGAELSINVENGFTNNLKKGDSIAVNGVCLTVCSFTKKNIKFEIIHESLRLTNLIKNSSMPLNLERSLKIGDEIGGHLDNRDVNQATGRRSYIFFFLKGATSLEFGLKSKTKNFKTKSLGSYLGRPPRLFFCQGGCFEVAITICKTKILPDFGPFQEYVIAKDFKIS